VSEIDFDSGSELLTYGWRQVSGPGVDINNEDSLNSTVTIPGESGRRDARIILQLAADYQGRSQHRDVVTIFIERTKEAQDIEQETLGPSGDGQSNRAARDAAAMVMSQAACATLRTGLALV
jgi:hypothetical protein